MNLVEELRVEGETSVVDGPREAEALACPPSLGASQNQKISLKALHNQNMFLGALQNPAEELRAEEGTCVVDGARKAEALPVPLSDFSPKLPRSNLQPKDRKLTLNP